MLQWENIFIGKTYMYQQNILIVGIFTSTAHFYCWIKHWQKNRRRFIRLEDAIKNSMLSYISLLPGL